MTGPWEERLRNLAEGGTDWDVPAREDLVKKLGQLRSVLDKAASEPGITGKTGTKATDTFSDAGKNVQKLADYLDEEVGTRVSDANLERERARGYLAELSGGALSPTQEAIVRGAAIGSTIVLGPLSILAGEGAVGLINGFLGSRREDDAKKYVQAVSDNLDSIEVQPAPTFPWTPGDQSFEGGDPSTFGSGTPGTRAPSFQQYPDFDVDPKNPDTGDPGTQIEIEDPEVIGPDDPVLVIPDDPTIDIVPTPVGPETNFPTPDGPVGSGVTTLPGQGGGHTVGGVPGGGSSGVGGGSVGLGLAAGGAAGLARATRIGAGGLGGAGSARPGGSAKAGGGRGGGLLGKSSAAAGVGGVGTPAGGSRGAAGGTRGGGVMAGGGAPGGGAPAGRGGAGARGAMAGGAGGVGGVGGRGEKKNERGRGLGGPIAPNIEDDEDFGPRSENAGAGGRD